MYNYYGTKNQKGFLLTYDLGEKELILLMANFEDVLDYYSDGERNTERKPLYLSSDFEKNNLVIIDREKFLHLFNKWFIIHSSTSNEKVPYITSAMKTWSIYN